MALEETEANLVAYARTSCRVIQLCYPNPHFWMLSILFRLAVRFTLWKTSISCVLSRCTFHSMRTFIRMLERN